MRALRKLRFRLRALFRGAQLDRDAEAEMRFHLEMEARDRAAGGASPAEARRTAAVSFGGIERVKEDVRDARGVRWLEEFLRDLRHGARLLLRSPGFTIVAVLTLALGIGINTGIFSAFKGIVLRPLPGVSASRELVALLWTTRGGDKLTLSYAELRDFQQRTRTLGGLEATGALPFSLDDGTRAQRVWGEFATGGLHAMLGAKPFLGRMLLPEDDRFPGGAMVVVLSHGFWRRQFGGDRGVIGRTVLLNGHACTVVGVAQRGFVGTSVGMALDLFVPVAAAEHLRPFGGNGTELFTNRRYRTLVALGRLQPGTSFEQARAELATIGADLAHEHPADYEGMSAALLSILDSPFGAQTYVGPIFGLMMGMTALVLLIMCANVANLLLARATTREHEIAIRLAVGAGRFRLVRQLLTESLLLAGVGGALGGLLALATPAILGALWPTTRFPIVINADPDLAVLLFTIAASFASAFAFGLLPALQCSRSPVLPALKTGRTDGHRGTAWGRSLLVVTQIAVSIPLLVAAGLLLRSVERQRHADFGFDPHHVALLSIDLRPNGYDETRGREFCSRLLDEIDSLPGVEAASLANVLPLRLVPGSQSAVEVDGYVRPANEASLVLYNVVTRDALRTLRTPLEAGREFSAADTADSARVAIVNQTMARRYWPGQGAIGRSFRARDRTWEVVGVARDIKYLTPTESPQPHFYVPQNQYFVSELTLQVRTSGEPGLMFKSVQDRIARLDPHLPVFSVETMEDYLKFALSLSAFAADGLLLTGALGLALTAMGVFGTVSYAVSLRTREIGVRVALGASRTDVVGLVVRQGLLLAGAGAAIGFAGAAASTRLLKSLLFETAASDPLTFFLVLLVVGATTLLACWLPAHRATAVDPIIALRAE